MLPVLISRQSPPDALSLEACKEYLRIFDDSHNGTILLMLSASIRAIENYTRQHFIQTVYSQSFEDEPVVLSCFPVITIESATVDGEALTSPELQSLTFDKTAAPTELKPPSSDPTLLGTSSAITYKVGWLTWPEDLILLVLEKLGESFENRKASGPAITNRFTRAHTLALEHYCSHHDAIR